MGAPPLHKLKWAEGRAYSAIADTYASFTTEWYWEAIVIFDGYEKSDTKDNKSVGRLPVWKMQSVLQRLQKLWEIGIPFQ